jgi:homoserine dehydrogenase
LFLNQIKKLKGILNGTTNFILSEMEQKNLSFDEVLKNAQLNGYAEIDPTNDIEGLDAAHKLTLLSSICFCSEINFNNNEISGINGIHIDDILNAKKLGYKIKLISETSIINNQIACVTEPKLIRIDNPLANVNGVLNAINIETDQLKNLFLEGEGAGGKATASSVIADLFIISSNSNTLSLGHKTSKLKAYKKFSSLDIKSSFYMRIMTKDITGVLSKITSYFNESGISIEKILQLPESINKNTPIPIIITTHEVEKNLLINAIRQIEKLDFILEKINIITIDKN